MSTVAENPSWGLESIPVVALIPCLKSLLIVTIFSSFLVPTGIVLFVFSTPALRRRPSFILNVCAICLGLTQGIVAAYVVIREMVLRPLNPALVSVLTALYIVGPICVQTILFLRVLAAYPPHLFPLPVRFAMYGPAIALKAARVANACYLLYTTELRTDGPKTIMSESATVWSSPFAKSELLLQLIDDVYISTVFLLRIHSGVKFNEKQPHSHGPRPPPPSGGSSYATRIRTLFWIALSNFAFPVIFDLAQLVLVFRDPDFVQGAYVLSVNSHVSILGVLFATIWASGTPPPAASVTASSVGSHSHSNPSGTLIVAGHLPLSAHPGPVAVLPAVPPESKVRRPGSRTDFDAASTDGDSSEEHRLLFKSPAVSGHPTVGHRPHPEVNSAQC